LGFNENLFVGERWSSGGEQATGHGARNLEESARSEGFETPTF
jgi:hypothetical protein